MVIAVRAILVTLLELFSIFSEGLLALFAGESLEKCKDELEAGGKRWVPFPSSGEGGGFLVPHDTRHNQTTFDLESGQIFCSKEQAIKRDLQQGDLIETCALRMCLLDWSLALLAELKVTTYHMVSLQVSTNFGV